MAGRRGGSGSAAAGMTPLELKIMQVLWRMGPCQVQAVQQELEGGLAYTTVQTMLNVLHKKGRVTRRLRGRAYEYRAVVSEEKTLGKAVADLVDRMFGGSPEELVMSLVKSRQLDAGRLEKLAERVDAARAAKKKDRGRDRDA
ncbi:MAG TPA: BlaI/MecI/CopY family transcriptional regulator [Acidobacteriaceae bacterium]